ncbi:MAG: hypothetical protein M3464_10145 [Chloroflexota bacterium]|nr:hypothetical protein [Chloroflexota bacterium]
MSSRPRWRFWEKERPPEPDPPETLPTRRPSRWQRPPLADPARQDKLDQLRRRREMIAYDLERAESARQPDNPWQERIALLDASLATIEADLAAVEQLPPEPSFPLPATPISNIATTGGEPAAIAFQIGPERFVFEEETDWDQRGGPVVRGELRRRTGDVARLVPAEIPVDERDALLAHLTDSVTVFATDLRDRALEGEPLPVQPTLADLARPDPEFGGWRDWRGASAAAARRAWRRQQLQAEAQRLLTERETELEDRAKWAERLPIARRRLADVDEQIANLEQ